MEFLNKSNIQQSDIENNKFLFLFYGLSFYLSEIIGGHRTNGLLGGSNLTPPPQISSIIHYIMLSSEIVCHFYTSI